ncbi:TRANSDUCIN/WD40 REPEAT-LIKE SUPERFAMILY PROTEIN-RELATED [Salix koriyanagi]|uniref:TRANSDUCIN/WD40 REPEAT-LIKE SUPERFAMILY PROTEIN-RELATED n=1 Tax=Salix koriyanagi TaxID=2511006 RepID=A0A9Q1AM21_9ROSI|nr:TRANSDUCIN/WD40 REPEAT-LIKE SUPERFAMILY PROTEIN-RELATED [Salix koriyanagi]
MSRNDTIAGKNDNSDGEEQLVEGEEEEEHFYESLDRIACSSCSCSTSNSDSDPDPTHSNSPRLHASNYHVWISQPESISERRQRLLLQMGLCSDPSLSRSKPEAAHSGDFYFNRSLSSDRLIGEKLHGPCPSDSTAIARPRSDSGGSVDHDNDDDDAVKFDGDEFNSCCSSSVYCSPSIFLQDSSNVNSNDSDCSCSDNNINNRDSNDGPFVAGCGKKCKSKNGSSPKEGSGSFNVVVSPNKPPLGKQHCRKMEMNRSDSANSNGNLNGSLSVGSSVEFAEELECDGADTDGAVVGEGGSRVCTIKNLDNGKEFVVNEIREDGMWNQLKEVGTGRQLTMEEFEMSVGHSPIVQELMRRQIVEDRTRENLDADANGRIGGGVSKFKKKGSWFRSIKSVANNVTGNKERRSSDERDTGSEKGGRRSSSATDDSQDVSFHGPERVRVRQYGRPSKELSALYKSQEIQAHNGSIWCIKFSLDGRYLASAGEDCVINIWQVVESERKGELLMEKPYDGGLNLLLMANGSPEPNLLSPLGDTHQEKKRRGRSSIHRKSLSLDHIIMPETVFALTDKPICSFKGHLDDVLDLSWSKSQNLLSSSMDKTVRLWHLSSNTCLKIFSHSDYVTCIQFNPVDDRYFISGSLDAKVRIWSIPDRQVVDWNDLHEMVTAALLYSRWPGNKLQHKCQINLQNKKKKAHLRKITGFQFAPGSSSEVIVTSADSRIRVIDGVDLVHKFKGFRNTNSQISASLTANGKYVVSASEDSYVYVWKHDANSRLSRSKGVTVTHSYEHFHCQDASVAIPWPGMGDTWGLQDTLSGEQSGLDNLVDEVSIVNHPPTPVEEASIEGLESLSRCTNSPLNGIISSATNGYFFDRISATWPEEKLNLATRTRSPNASLDISNGLGESVSAYGMVIVTAGLRGEIRTFQNFGLPVRI